MTSEPSRRGIGDNNPPEPMPFEAASSRVDDLYTEAQGWLDGEPVTTQGQADALAGLIQMLREAHKTADDARKAEKKPFDDAIKAIQARYKPVLDKASSASDVAKKALSPWLAKIEAEKRAEAERKRLEAEKAQQAARDAAEKARKAYDLAAAEEAQRLADQAQAADRIARSAENAKARSKGGAGRAIGLKTTYHPNVTDYSELARHVWRTDAEAMKDWLLEYAQKQFRAGKRDLPGVEIIEKKEAV